MNKALFSDESRRFTGATIYILLAPDNRYKIRHRQICAVDSLRHSSAVTAIFPERGKGIVNER